MCRTNGCKINADIQAYREYKYTIFSPFLATKYAKITSCNYQKKYQQIARSINSDNQNKCQTESSAVYLEVTNQKKNRHLQQHQNCYRNVQHPLHLHPFGPHQQHQLLPHHFLPIHLQLQHPLFQGIGSLAQTELSFHPT